MIKFWISKTLADLLIIFITFFVIWMIGMIIIIIQNRKDKRNKKNKRNKRKWGSMKNESIAASYCINIPEDATNGDVVKTLFPSEEIYESDSACVYVGAKMRFDVDWWNAPYKAESEVV